MSYKMHVVERRAVISQTRSIFPLRTLRKGKLCLVHETSEIGEFCINLQTYCFSTPPNSIETSQEFLLSNTSLKINVVIELLLSNLKLVMSVVQI